MASCGLPATPDISHVTDTSGQSLPGRKLARGPCGQPFRDGHSWRNSDKNVLSLQPSQVPSHTCGSQCQPQFTGVHGPGGIFVELVERGLEDGGRWESPSQDQPQSEALAPEGAKGGASEAGQAGLRLQLSWLPGGYHSAPAYL